MGTWGVTARQSDIGLDYFVVVEKIYLKNQL